MDNTYGIEIPEQISEATRCGLCRYCNDEKDRGLVCVHPEGAALYTYASKVRVHCRNWEQDDGDTLKLVQKLKSHSTKD